jgi:putative ABC transport system permease protein
VLLDAVPVSAKTRHRRDPLLGLAGIPVSSADEIVVPQPDRPLPIGPRRTWTLGHDASRMPGTVSFATDLRYGVRALRKNPRFAAAAIAILTLGIGSNTTLFAVVHSVLLRPLPYASPNQLVALSERTGRPGDDGRVSGANFLDLTSRVRSVANLAAFRPWGFVLTGAGEPRRVIGARVSWTLFPLLGVTAMAGRTFLPTEDRFGSHHVVLLSQRIWEQALSADPSIVGRTISLSGETYVVVGVLPQRIMPLDADVWVPLALEPFVMTQRGNRALTVLGRLDTAADLEKARSDVNVAAGELLQRHPDLGPGWTIAVSRFQDVVVGDVRSTVMLVWGAVGLVLLIACANAGSLAAARAGTRWQETAICAALGASRARIIRQVVTESTLLAVVSAALGLVLAGQATAFFVSNGPASFPRLREVTVDATVAGFAVALSVIVGVLFSMLPALLVNTAGGSSALAREILPASRDNHRALQNLAVALQVALGVFVLVGAGLLTRSMQRVVAVDLGFHPERVLTMTTSPTGSRFGSDQKRSGYYEALLEEVRRLPDVRAAGLVSHLPFGQRLTTAFAVAGDAPRSDVPLVDYVAASPDYFAAIGTPVLRGRPFGEIDAMGQSPTVVINEVLAQRFWPGGDALGQKVVVGATLGAQNTPREIVGIVANSRTAGVERPAPATVYIPSLQNPWPGFALVVRSDGDPRALAPLLRAAVRRLDPDQPTAQVRALTTTVAGATAQRRFQLTLVGLYALIALVLALAGVYAVTALAVRERNREIGIRLALGARRAGILRLVIGGVMRWSAAGVLLGAALAFATSRFISAMLFEVSPTDLGTFGVVIAATIALVVIAAVMAGRRALAISPLAAIREP